MGNAADCSSCGCGDKDAQKTNTVHVSMQDPRQGPPAGYSDAPVAPPGTAPARHKEEGKGKLDGGAANAAISPAAAGGRADTKAGMEDSVPTLSYPPGGTVSPRPAEHHDQGNELGEGDL